MLGRLAGLLACVTACSFEVGAHPVGGDDVHDAMPSHDGMQGCIHSDWLDPAFPKRYPLTVQAAKVTGSPGDMAMLVAFTSAELKTARADGGDIVFTAGDGKTVLPFEIERFDPTAGSIVAWVRLVSLSSTANTKLFVYWGSAGAAPVSRQQDVWGDYLAVWHLREDPGSSATPIHDSTTHGSDLASQGMTTADRVTGKIGAGFAFDGQNNGLSRATFALPAQFTYEAWAKPSLVSGFHVVFDTSNYDRWFGFNGADVDFYNGATDHFAMTTVTAGSWHYIVATSDGTTLQMYLDGAAVGPPFAMALPAETASLRSGFSTAGEWFSGTLDELRVSSAVLTPAQIATRYANQSTPDQFMTLETIEHCP